MKSEKIILGALAGLAAGALLGILFAPDKGTQFRKKMAGKGAKYVDDVQEKFDDFLGAAKQKFASHEEEAKDLVAKGKAKYEDGKKEFKNTIV